MAKSTEIEYADEVEAPQGPAPQLKPQVQQPLRTPSTPNHIAFMNRNRGTYIPQSFGHVAFWLDQIRHSRINNQGTEANQLPNRPDEFTHCVDPRMVMNPPRKRNFAAEDNTLIARAPKRRAVNLRVDSETVGIRNPEILRAQSQHLKLQYEPLPGDQDLLEPINHFEEAYEVIMAAREALAEDGDESPTEIKDGDFWSYSDYE